MNKRTWRKRARKWKKRAYGWAGTCGRAVRKRDERVEELRHDNIRLATQLARVQGVCDKDEAEGRNLLGWQRRARGEFDTLYDFTCECVPEGFRDRTGYELGDEKCQFFTEVYLYALIGKEDARTLLARMNKLRLAIESEPAGSEEVGSSVGQVTEHTRILRG